MKRDHFTVWFLIGCDVLSRTNPIVGKDEDTENLDHDKDPNTKIPNVHRIAESIVDNVIENINDTKCFSKASSHSDHKSLVLSVMKKAMRDVAIGYRDKTNQHDDMALESSEPGSSFLSSKPANAFKNSPGKSLATDNDTDVARKGGLKSPHKKKIIESLVDEMVKVAFSSIGSNDKVIGAKQRPEQESCGSTIVTSIVDDMLDKAVYSLNEMSEYNDVSRTNSSLNSDENREDNELRNYFVWEAPNDMQTPPNDTSNDRCCYESAIKIHPDKFEELNHRPNDQMHIRCDICCQIAPHLFANESELKTHTLKTHINPLFLSPNDLSQIGGISAIIKANETKLTAFDLEKLQNDTISPTL